VSRVAACLLGSLALAGCGGSAAPTAPTAPTGAAPVAGTKVVTGEVRSPDARTPLVRADGLWLCETSGSVELRVSPEGLATLSLDGRLLASTTGRRALINRACDSELDQRLPPFRPLRATLAPALVRCLVPRRVLVDLREGDLTVRGRGGGRFLLGAAVSAAHLEVAAYWSGSCAPR